MSDPQQVLTHITPSAKRILHVGCGAGRLGQAIRARRPVEVVGIERQSLLAEAAKRHLDQVIAGDVQSLEEVPDLGTFDCILCNILARLKDPWAVLKRCRGWLAPDGQLLAVVPNVRHHAVLTMLLGGAWGSASSSALRPGNLRYFTRREIEKTFYRAGFDVRMLHGIPGPGYDAWDRQGRKGEVAAGKLRVEGLAPETAEEFYTSDYLVDATPRQVPQRGLTSIIVLTYNQLEYTRLCVDSILRYTDEPIELVFVDNASTDGTPDYLRTVPGAKLIVNSENRGFPAGVNQGIQAAAGQNVLLLNNDVVVTTGWLDRLLRALYSVPAVGLVGPVSNNVSGPQQIRAAYEDLARLDGFAWEHGKVNDGRCFSTDRLVGFALLIRREVIERIGFFDERFGIGCFEDDDFCRRAAAAGYQLLIASDAFIHHFGSQTFRASGVDLGHLLQENERVYRKKWEGDASAQGAKGPPPDPSQKAPAPVSRWAVRSAPEGGLLLEPNKPVISLCVICRDNAGTLEACLNSIRPWVDEMIVVDTGSRDNTPELVRACGAQLHHFPWCDDFAAARNESVRHARGEWVFWMDSDDTIDLDNGRKLREVAAGASDPSVLGYVMQVHCPGAGDDGKREVTVVDHVKLFRNRPDLRFEGRIHEQVLPAIRRAGGEVAFTDVFVVHSGADHTPEGRQRKLDRDFRLLELDLKDRPDHPFVLFNLGMTHGDAGNHEEAVEALRRSLEVSQPTESHVRKVYALLVGSHAQLGRHEEAWQACREGRRHYPDDAELLFREGVLHQHFGRLPEAERAYMKVLGNHGPRHFASVDRGIHGFKARHNLALVYEAMDDLPKAEAQWRQVVAEEPTYRTGWRGLGEVLLHQGRMDDADRVANQMSARSPAGGLAVEALILQGRVAAQRQDRQRALSLFAEAVRRRPDDRDALHALCQFLFEHGPPDEAEQALRDLADRFPDDAAARHNLGSLHLQTGRYEEAVKAYRESIRLRPDHVPTHIQLGHALRAAGRTAEAVVSWQEALRRDPRNRAAQQALDQAVSALRSVDGRG